jgi:hypothetical protein
MGRPDEELARVGVAGAVVLNEGKRDLTEQTIRRSRDRRRMGRIDLVPDASGAIVGRCAIAPKKQVRQIVVSMNTAGVGGAIVIKLEQQRTLQVAPGVIPNRSEGTTVGVVGHLRVEGVRAGSCMSRRLCKRQHSKRAECEKRTDAVHVDLPSSFVWASRSSLHRCHQGCGSGIRGLGPAPGRCGLGSRLGLVPPTMPARS